MPSIIELNRKEIIIRAAVESDAAALASLTAEIGCPINEQTARAHLRELTGANDLMFAAAADSADALIDFIFLHRTYFLHRAPRFRPRILLQPRNRCPADQGEKAGRGGEKGLMMKHRNKINIARRLKVISRI